MTVQELVTSVVASVGASAALTAALVWFAREWISTRLKSSIQHEYDQKLEAYKSQLRAQSEISLLHLRTALEREAALHAAAHASFSEGQRAAMERRLSGIDKLWDRVVGLRNGLPPVLTFMDVLTISEYRTAKGHPTFQTLIGALSEERISKLAGDGGASIEQVRPYVGEYLWAVFFSYQAIMLRILFLLHLGRDDAEKLEWHKDTGTRQLIEAVMTADELQEFDGMQFGKITWVQRRLESKILAAARKVISGEEFGAESLEQAKTIQYRAAKLQAESKSTTHPSHA